MHRVVTWLCVTQEGMEGNIHLLVWLQAVLQGSSNKDGDGVGCQHCQASQSACKAAGECRLTIKLSCTLADPCPECAVLGVQGLTLLKGSLCALILFQVEQSHSATPGSSTLEALGLLVGVTSRQI